MRHAFALVTILALAPLAVAANETSKFDAWETPDGAKAFEHDGCKPADVRYVEVAEAGRERAATMLAENAAVELDGAAFAAFAGREIGPEFAGLKPYLVRAVALNEATGTYFVQKCDSVLWVAHASLGRIAPPPTRRGLVVFLAAPPSKVIVTASMGQ